MLCAAECLVERNSTCACSSQSWLNEPQCCSATCKHPHNTTYTHHRQELPLQQSPVAGGSSEGAPTTLEPLHEAVAAQLIGPAALRSKVVSEEKQEMMEESGGKTLVTKRVVEDKEVELFALPDHACCPFVADCLKQVGLRHVCKCLTRPQLQV